MPCFLFPVTLIFILLAERSYDQIPNFSAADALRLTGIGRNEFIDIMNKCRSKVKINSILLFWFQCACMTKILHVLCLTKNNRIVLNSSPMCVDCSCYMCDIRI